MEGFAERGEGEQTGAEAVETEDEGICVESGRRGLGIPELVVYADAFYLGYA